MGRLLEPQSMNQRRPLLGVAFLFLFCLPFLFSLAGLFGLGSADADTYVNTVKTWGRKKGITLNQEDLKMFAERLRSADIIALRVTSALLPIPLLLIGLRLLLGDGHPLWSWQAARRRRHPVLAGMGAYAVWMLAVGVLHNATVTLMDPFGESTSSAKELLVAAVSGIIAVWVYIGNSVIFRRTAPADLGPGI